MSSGATDDQPRTFLELRGTTKEAEREDSEDDLRSAASYCAQFGIPLGDCEEQHATNKELYPKEGSHLAMLRWCNSWLTDAEFRSASLLHATRPLDKLQELQHEHAPGIEGPLTDPEFDRTANILGSIDLAFQRRFFGFEDVTDEEIDAFVDEARKWPGGAWLNEEVRPDVRRAYALSVMAVKRENEQQFQRLYVQGEAWNNYDKDRTPPENDKPPLVSYYDTDERKDRAGLDDMDDMEGDYFG